jgi:membrane protease subunit (stomatin/prohibitin family)
MAFGRQLCDVVEWNEFREDQIFYKWSNGEIKKGSRLIIRPGQDAIFMYNGRIEGIFTDEGDYDIESNIIPFLSTLKGFKFGFNSGIRAEVLFINTKEFQVKWGTKSPINIPSASVDLPGGLPIRANGTFTFKVRDYMNLIENVAGVKSSYLVEDIRERVSSVLDQLLMKWISKEGKDMFNLQSNSFEISKGIKEDLDMELSKIGISITGFNVMSFNYPKEIQDMIQKVASQSMVGNVNKYSQIAMADSIGRGNSAGGHMAADMATMMAGMQMGREFANTMNGNNQPTTYNNPTGKTPKFCPECGTPTNGAKFCPECGMKLV